MPTLRQPLQTSAKPFRTPFSLRVLYYFLFVSTTVTTLEAFFSYYRSYPRQSRRILLRPPYQSTKQSNKHINAPVHTNASDCRSCRTSPSQRTVVPRQIQNHPRQIGNLTPPNFIMMRIKWGIDAHQRVLRIINFGFRVGIVWFNQGGVWIVRPAHGALRMLPR